MLTWIKRIVVLVVFVLIVGGGVYWYFGRQASGPVQYRTSKVERGELLLTIGATGTLEPTDVIDVGSQVTGQIMQFGTDTNGKPVDYTSDVKAGALLAKIDDTTYKATLDAAQAQYDQAKAGVLKSQADLQTAQAKAEQASNDWDRAQKIGPGDALAQTNYDNYKSTYQQSVANIADEAELASAQANVTAAQSTVNSAEQNVGYCTINSPVDGKIIDRRVDLGQTVVSAMSVSSMFLIARDLHHMQVWVAVNEADVGKIHSGQAVTFTCDAFGDRKFRGTVGKVRLDAQNTQNVVIYTVEVNTENPDLALMPYLTADVEFEVERHENVLTVPNAALRWAPTSIDEVASDAKSDPAAAAITSGGAPHFGGGPGGGGGGGPGGFGGGGPGGPKPPGAPVAGKEHPAVLWVKDGDFVRPLHVTASLTDGAITEVKGDALAENMEVISGVVVQGADAAAGGSTNPFLPQFRRR